MGRVETAIYDWVRVQTFIPRAEFANAFWPRYHVVSQDSLVKQYAHKMRKLGITMKYDRARRGYHVTVQKESSDG
jgi:hypothetical protein